MHQQTYTWSDDDNNGDCDDDGACGDDNPDNDRDHDHAGDDNRAHDQFKHKQHRATTSRTWDSSRKQNQNLIEYQPAKDFPSTVLQ